MDIANSIHIHKDNGQVDDYKVVTEGKTTKLVERTTGMIVDEYDSEKIARLTAKRMNSGMAFNGFTPAFIAKGHVQEEERIPAYKPSLDEELSTILHSI